MTNGEEKIIDAFKKREWQEIQSAESWRIFKIISELVEGFEKLARIGPCVSIFGSARTEPGTKFYKLAEEIAFKLTQIRLWHYYRRWTRESWKQPTLGRKEVKVVQLV